MAVLIDFHIFTSTDPSSVFDLGFFVAKELGRSLCCGLASFENGLLIRRGQLLEHLLGNHQRLDREDVADLRDVLLDLIELHRVDREVRIVLTVDDLFEQHANTFRDSK